MVRLLGEEPKKGSIASFCEKSSNFTGVMTLFLTGSPTRYGEDHFTSDNGFLDRVKAELPERPFTLLVSAAPDDVGFTDSVLKGMSD